MISKDYPITVISFKLDGLTLGCGRNSTELMHYLFSNQATSLARWIHFIANSELTQFKK